MSSPGSSRPTSPSPSEPVPQASFRTPYRFAFGHQRGPASVISDANESRVDFSVTELNTRSQDVYSSLELPDAGNYTFAPGWSSSRHGFNAISTVLNNPHRNQAPLKSSRAPLPIAISPDLPRVRRKDFDAYVNEITPAWEQFSRHTPQRTISSSMLHSSIKGKTREIPPLSTVPAIFFDPSFDLRNPHTFAYVTEQNDPSSSLQQTLNPEDISLHQVLQEKLSHYMDVVEQHLTREVQARSTSFFAALSNLQDLQTEGADCLDRISSLRQRLQDVDSSIVHKGLQTIKLQKRLSNIQTVEQATTALKELTEMLSMCDRLIGEANWDEALALLALLEDISFPQNLSAIGSENGRDTTLQNGGALHIDTGLPLQPASSLAAPPSQHALSSPGKRHSTVAVSPELRFRHLSYSLPSLSALSSLPDRISVSRSRISSTLRSSVVDLLRSDLIHRFELSASSNNIAPGTEKLRQRLIPLWHGLLRTGGVSETLHAYHDVVLSSVRSCVRKCLPQKTDADDDVDLDSAKNMSERTASLAQELRNLTHPEFTVLLRALYAGLLNLLDGVVEHSNLFNDRDLQEIKVPSATRVANQQALEAVLPEVLPAATELANTRLSKVVMVRSEQNASLSLPEFLIIFNEGWAFVVKCEIMARKMIVGLRGVMVSQAKAFLTSYHNARLSSSATLVENEQWAQVEVPAASQRWADLLAESAVGTPPEFMQQPEHPSNGTNGAASLHGSQATTGSKQLLVEGRPYFVVGATLKVIEMLLDYLRVIVNLSLLTTDAMSRTIEYLKAFNSRTCQVVLGAGAMRSAGLKNITAKHLALASQSLSVMIALIPYVRETFRRHLNPKQAVILIEFDKLKRDYHEHQNEIHSKLIAIMGDRLAFHCKTLHSINWEDAQPAESPNMYMKVLMKETLTLHKVLSKYLATQAVEFVMSQVFAAINHRLSEEYAKIDLPSQEAKDRLLKDARFLQQELSGLKDINMSNTMLETVVQEKPVRRNSPFAARRASALVPSPAGDASSSLLSVVSSDRTPRTSITGPEDSSISLLLSSDPATTVNSTPPEAPGGNTLKAELPPSRSVGNSEKPANGGFREVIDTESTAEEEEELGPVPPAKDSSNLGPEKDAMPLSHEG